MSASALRLGILGTGGIVRLAVPQMQQFAGVAILEVDPAYFTSGYERALVITLDGYGTGLAGSVSEGANAALPNVAAERAPVVSTVSSITLNSPSMPLAAARWFRWS